MTRRGRAVARAVSESVIALGVALLGGCGLSQNAAVPDAASNGDLRPFLPVNLLLNSGAIVDVRDSIELKYVQQKFLKSGLFARVELGLSPLPLTLRADYSFDCANGPGEVAGALAASATLFVVPHPETCDYTIKTRFYFGTRDLGERVYTATYTKTIGLFAQSQVAGDEKGIDAAFDKMLADFRQNPPLPRVEPLKPPAAGEPQGGLRL